jgi:hypothetical protein
VRGTRFNKHRGSDSLNHNVAHPGLDSLVARGSLKIRAMFLTNEEML